ncbi:Redoxin [Botrimarina colliarenosi]|uniref:Redoxin n=1 Tax=Botrimarina colliarenosi TaxID=2528001 RepID=A0A5C6AL44_9BACT|nr:redoxin family protein [Botrimarina colliarenosi]TWU00198.1 Redoxin [Botrimarina colliarenosi]
MTPCYRALLIALAVTASPAAFGQGSAPTAEQALGLSPIQKGVEYDTPTGDEAKACTIKAERDGKGTSWIVRDGSGRILRRFADANSDNVVDTWCYYAAGLEVYRDIDADFDNRADQYRWFHTGGSRWGLDENEDTKIDSWKRISPQEVAEEAFLAVQNKDLERFERLLLTTEEAKSLGLGKTLAENFADGRQRAASEFKQLVSTQKAIDAKSRFVDFGAPRPGVIPAGLDGSTKDVVVYENASALADAGGAPEQLLLGSMVQVGDGWRLVEAPQTGATGPELANVFSVPTLQSSSAAGAPSDEVQSWMTELDKLDRQAASLKPADREKLTDRRVMLLEKLAESATRPDEATAWYKQLAGLLSAAIQADGYKQGVAKLGALARSPGVQRVGKDLEAHFRYQQIAAENGLAYQNPKADFAKVQQNWISDLESFVKTYPTSPDAADALLQLGSMAGEFAGESEVAEKWYRQAAAEFPNTVAGKKAAGAVRRLGSVGKVLPLTGPTLSGRKLDLAAAPYKGRFVLVHYWTTWSGPEGDFAQIDALRQKYRGKFDAIGVNLDSDPAAAKAFLGKTKSSWEHLYDADGLDGDRATSIGVINLPLMLLVDDRGRVVNRNLTAGELETELQRVVR